MAIEQGQCTVFKLNLLKGIENFNAGTPYIYKMALYTAEANLNADTLSYSTANEIVGAGYTAGGQVIIPVTPSSSGKVAYVTFADVLWTPASFTARGGLIYNSTTGNAVAVLNFGSDKVATTSFLVSFPPSTADAAVIRLT